MTPAFLLLTGSVEFPDGNQGLGSIELDLNGVLQGGGSLEIDATITPYGVGGGVAASDSGKPLWALPQTGACPTGFCQLSSLFPTGALQIYDPALKTGTPADLWLDINSTGRVIYDPDNAFVGAVPEPGSLFLLGAGLLGGLGALRKRSSR